MKTAILTCVNDRPNISSLIFECYKRLKEYELHPENLCLIVGVSSIADKEMVYKWCDEDSGVHIVHTTVTNTGFKFNEVLRYAMESVSRFDAFLIMGDDDSISAKGFHAMCDTEIDYTGFNTNAYVDCRTGQAMQHTYSYENKLIGAGRMISLTAVLGTCYRQEVVVSRDYDDGATKYTKGESLHLSNSIAEYLCGYGYAKKKGELTYTGLWPNKLKRGLDHASELKLVANGVVPYAIQFDDRIHITDFKTVADIGGKEQNIWPYSILERKCKPITFEEATWFMGKAELEIVNKLRKK